MTAASDSNQEIPFSGNSDGCDHIGHARTAGDEGGTAIDHAVPYLAGFFIGWMARANECTLKFFLQGRSGEFRRKCGCGRIIYSHYEHPLSIWQYYTSFEDQN